MTQQDQGLAQPAFPQARSVSPTTPLAWLKRGWDDLLSCPGPSLFYGLCFATMGFLIKFVFANAYEYLSALASGFLLLGPFLAIGLYEISRRRERGEGCTLAPTLAA